MQASCFKFILYIYGGKISGGQASDIGGNIYVTSGTTDATKSTFNMSGTATISNGTAVGNKAGDGGGNLYLTCSANTGSTLMATISGGTLSGGKAIGSDSFTDADGGNIYISKGTLTISGGTITAGEARSDGDGILVGYWATKVVLQGSAKIQNNGASNSTSVEDISVNLKSTNYLTLGQWNGNDADKALKITLVTPGNNKVVVAPDQNVTIDDAVLSKFISANSDYNLALNSSGRIVLKTK